MPFDGAVIAALTGGAFLLSIALAAIHYRRANKFLTAEILRHRNALSSISEGNARYRTLFEHAPTGCLVWEPGFKIVEWNQQAERLFGWERETIIGRSFLDILIPARARIAFTLGTANLFADGQSCHAVLPGMTRDGGILHCEWHHAVVRDEQGSPIRIVSQCLDITHQKRLLQENALFRSVLEFTDDPSVMLLEREIDGPIVYASDAACRHFGKTRDELLSSTFPALDPFLSPRTQEDIGYMLSGRKPCTFESRHVSSAGDAVPVEVTMNFIEHEEQSYVAAYISNISERKAKEARLNELEIKAALQNQETHYREVFEHASDALFVVAAREDGQLCFQSLNPAAEEAFNLPAATLIGSTFEEILEGHLGQGPAISLGGSIAHYRECLATGLPTEFESILALRPPIFGTPACLHVKLLPLAGDRGIERIIGIGRDVTLRQKYEAELLERVKLEERMSRYFENAPGFFLTLEHRTDGSLAMPFASPGIRETHGIEAFAARDDVQSLFSLIPPDDARHLREQLEKSAQTLQSCRIDYRIRHPQNGERWIEYIAQPQRTPEDGTVWQGFMHDITERKLADRQLALLYAALNQSADAVFLIDHDLRFIYVNDAACLALGYSRADFQNLSPMDVAPDIRRKDLLQFMTRTQEEASIETFESLQRRRDGSTFPVEIGAALVTHGGTQLVIAVTRDIGARKAMEAARESALAEAQRLAQLRSSFLARASHELRTPLNGILGHVQLLLKKRGGDEAYESALNAIQTSGDHLHSCINDILDHARMESDRLELQIAPIELPGFFAGIVRIVRVKAEQKRLAFLQDIAPDLPRTVLGDEYRLRQILLNLLSNAIKYTDQGQITLRAASVAPSRIRFEVADTGIGIDPSQRHEVFEPFRQIGNLRRHSEGSGLGLAISQYLVRQMGGDIALDSAPHAGSVFSFEIEMPSVPSAPAPSVPDPIIPDPPPLAEARLFAPSPEELERLLEISRRGNMQHMSQHALELADQDETYRPFAEELIRLAKNYRSKALREFIQKFQVHE